MSESLVTIEATVRTATGKNANHKLRKAGKIPANLLEKGKATSLELDPKFLPKAWKSENKTFNLQFNGAVTKVKIQELAICPLKRNALHVDLLRI